ncbi:MAG TPA: HK97 family phage prohead protease [Polyangiales bacterium]|nr:HK97 family phage prohead protease [Polyangiales bacterium]
MEPCVPNVMRAAVEQIVKAKNPTTRELLHLITTANPDRAGDVVEAGGAQVDSFMRNPVVMADHDYSFEKIIGRAMSLEVRDGGIYARTQFRSTPLGEAAYNLAAEGIGGWSIGFRPIEYDNIKGEDGRTRGYRFKKWELLEYSIVAIPMNADAVSSAIQRGLVGSDIANVFFRMIKAEAPVLPEGTNPVAPPKVIRVSAASLREIQNIKRSIDRADAALRVTETARSL